MINKYIFSTVVILFCLRLFLPAQTIHIAYTGNLNCSLEACKCDGKYLGGIIQLANTIGSLKRKYPDLILLDSGDFLNTYPIMEANSLMIELISLLNYDAVSIGDQEYVEGDRFLYDHLEQYNIPAVCSNLYDRVTEELIYQPFKIINVGNVKIGIIGLIEEKSFSFIEMEGIKIYPIDSSLNDILNRITAQTDVILVLYHASFRNGLNLIKTFPQIDICICGHTQEVYEEQIGNKIVVQPGVDAEHLGLLEINFENEGKNYTNRFYPVNSVFGENLKFRKKSRSVFKFSE